MERSHGGYTKVCGAPAKIILYKYIMYQTGGEAPAQAPRASRNPALQLVGPAKGALHVPTSHVRAPLYSCSTVLFNLFITSWENRDLMCVSHHFYFYTMNGWFLFLIKLDIYIIFIDIKKISE